MAVSLRGALYHVKLIIINILLNGFTVDSRLAHNLKETIFELAGS